MVLLYYIYYVRQYGREFFLTARAVGKYQCLLVVAGCSYKRKDARGGIDAARVVGGRSPQMIGPAE